MPQSEHFPHQIDLLYAGGISILIEIGVTGNFDGIRQRELSVSAVLLRDPALHILVAVLNATIATEAFVHDPGPASRQRNRDLVGRTRRIGTDGAVHQRIGLILVDEVPLARSNRRNKNIGVVGWD